MNNGIVAIDRIQKYRTTITAPSRATVNATQYHPTIKQSGESITADAKGYPIRIQSHLLPSSTLFTPKELETSAHGRRFRAPWETVDASNEFYLFSPT